MPRCVQIRAQGQDDRRIEDREKRPRLARLMFDVALSKAGTRASDTTTLETAGIAAQK
jgi:hypothetical protein